MPVIVPTPPLETVGVQMPDCIAMEDLLFTSFIACTKSVLSAVFKFVNNPIRVFIFLST